MARNSTPQVEENLGRMAGSFEDALNRSTDNIKEPAKAPSGPWILRMTGFYLRPTPKEDLDADPDLPLGKVLFYHTPHEPLDGVDPEAVERGDWKGKRIISTRVIKEEGDDFKVLKLAAMHGINTEGRTLKQVLEACKGRFVRGTVSIYSYVSKQSGETVVENQISNFAPASED